jgi:flagellar biosynthetic protein FliP
MEKIKYNKWILSLLFSFLFFFLISHPVHAEGLIDVKIGDQGDLTSSVKIFVMVAILTIAPSIFIMFTCFTQVIIVLSLTRQGLGTMTLPPNQVLVALALFITVYIMSPVITEIDQKAYKPYQEKTITFEQAVEKAEVPLKKFMIKNTEDKDLRTFLKLRGDEKPKNAEDVSILAAVPAFTLSQITHGLFTGLMIYGAFIVIDMIVGSILMFMGMMMLPPQMISLPLKLLVFIYIGGFSKIVELLFNSIKV